MITVISSRKKLRYSIRVWVNIQTFEFTVLGEENRPSIDLSLWKRSYMLFKIFSQTPNWIFSLFAWNGTVSRQEIFVFQSLNPKKNETIKMGKAREKTFSEAHPCYFPNCCESVVDEVPRNYHSGQSAPFSPMEPCYYIDRSLKTFIWNLIWKDLVRKVRALFNNSNMKVLVRVTSIPIAHN